MGEVMPEDMLFINMEIDGSKLDFENFIDYKTRFNNW